jgi:hypothetical protein
MPQVVKALEQIVTEKHEFEARVSKDVKDLIPDRWNWRQIALKVGQVEEYDYIYSFASTLLHATPASITGDQKDLEISELEVFLRFIDVNIND